MRSWRAQRSFMSMASIWRQVASMRPSGPHAKMLERRKELTERLNVLCSQRDQCNTQIAQLQGALETTNYILDVWTNPRATSRHEEPSEPSPNGKAEVLAPDAAVAA